MVFKAAPRSNPMSFRARLPVVVLAALAATCGVRSDAELITMNVDPVGTTSNQNVYGTVLSGGVATWPARSQFRDYQFELQTMSGSTSFDAFAVRLSAQLRNNTNSYGNLLRATLWSGTMVVNPLLADALVTVTTPNSSFSNGSSGYSSILLSGSSFLPQVISTTPSNFFFRIWAEGGSNDGYQSKMAATLGEYQAVTMSPAPAIDGYIEFDTNNDGFIDSGEETSTRDVISEVPEPSAVALAAIGLAAAASLAARRAGSRSR
jgi:hypothetical protein